MRNESDSFRDNLYNVNEKGRRVGFFPKRPKGKFVNRRIVFSYFLLVIFFGLPWLSYQENPFLLFNLIERKFVFFFQPFFPQDFFLVALMIMIVFIAIFMFTAVLGRIWCGWACPQTVFLEMVYRRIEYWIEGDASAQRRLEKAPWKWNKIRKRTLKHTIFLVIAFFVSHTVLAYIIGNVRVQEVVTSSPLENPITFALVLINTGVFYFVFAWFREQACIYVCPYGRLQGVMFDKETLQISYDYTRGEPRTRIKRDDTEQKGGDCIDCKQCVAVCPTGIDIRNGVQLECVSCTACIDACDEIMDKVNRPQGLIRYASQTQIEKGTAFKVTPRAWIYLGVLTVLFGIFGFALSGTSNLKVKMLRAPGQTFTETPAGNVTNMYQMTLLNKQSKDRVLTFKLESSQGKLSLLGANSLDLPLESGGQTSHNVLVELPPAELKSLSFEITIGIYEDEVLLEKLTTRFNGPMK